MEGAYFLETFFWILYLYEWSDAEINAIAASYGPILLTFGGKWIWSNDGVTTSKVQSFFP